VQHQPVEPAYGYEFLVKNKKITYSGDTKYSKNLENASKNAEYLIHEVFVDLNFDDKRMTQETLKNVKEYHSTPEDVGKLAQAANVKNLVLNHFVPPVFDEEGLRNEISKYYDGKIIVGSDLDVFNL
jgi:ribonuclease Z